MFDWSVVEQLLWTAVMVVRYEYSELKYSFMQWLWKKRKFKAEYVFDMQREVMQIQSYVNRYLWKRKSVSFLKECKYSPRLRGFHANTDEQIWGSFFINPSVVNSQRTLMPSTPPLLFEISIICKSTWIFFPAIGNHFACKLRWTEEVMKNYCHSSARGAPSCHLEFTAF